MDTRGKRFRYRGAECGRSAESGIRARLNVHPAEENWTENYFAPRRAAEVNLAAKYPGNETVAEFIAGNHYEEELFATYGNLYGYVFYIGKKL